MDWRLSQLQRDAVTKRDHLAKLNAYLERLAAMLEEARSFEGDFREQIEALDRRLFEIGDQYSADAPALVRRASDADRAEAEGLRAQKRALEQERDGERERRTTTGSDGFHTLTFCELRPDDVSKKRAHVIIGRDAVARELAEVEAQLTPGELVQSGIEAPDLAEHRERVAAARERAGIEA